MPGAIRRRRWSRPMLPCWIAWPPALRRPILLLTLAPERPGAETLIDWARARGTLVAIGHSAARAAEVARAAELGAVLSTHLGNGLPHLLPKFDNPLLAQLAEDRLSASFIADGIHIPPFALRVLLRAKGLARSILVTDATAAAAAPAGHYELAGMAIERAADGAVRVPGASVLAGSSLELDQAVRNVVAWGIATATEAIAAGVGQSGARCWHRRWRRTACGWPRGRSNGHRTCGRCRCGSEMNAVDNMQRMALPLPLREGVGGRGRAGLAPNVRGAPTPPPSLGPLCGPSPQGEGESLPRPRLVLMPMGISPVVPQSATTVPQSIRSSRLRPLPERPRPPGPPRQSHPPAGPCPQQRPRHKYRPCRRVRARPCAGFPDWPAPYPDRA